MALAADLELKKAFQDLSQQMVTTREKIRQIKSEIDASQRLALALKVTQKTVGGLKPEHKTYEAVGRVFVHKEHDAVKDQLTKMITENEEKVKSLEQTKVYQESKVKESENNLRELINQKKNATK